MRVSLLLAAVGFGLTGGLGLAQVQTRPVPPSVIAGDDVGFRMEGRKGQTAVGRLVVRIDGQWVDAEFATGVKMITK